MLARERLALLPIVLSVVLHGCASGDGVPKARVENDLQLCIVEAAWVFDDGKNVVPYGWGLIPNGSVSEPREVVVGSAYAYAVVKQPDTSAKNGEGCYRPAAESGGVLYKSKAPFDMKAGETTLIVFSDATAAPADPSDPFTFARLIDAGSN